MPCIFLPTLQGLVYNFADLRLLPPNSSSCAITRSFPTPSTPQQVLVYNFADLRLLHAIETLSNPAGLLALSPSADSAVLACPGLHAGQVSRWQQWYFASGAARLATSFSGSP